MTRKLTNMPKVAILLSMVLLSLAFTNSYAFITGDLISEENIMDNSNFNSDIIQIDPDFFNENDIKRYLTVTGVQTCALPIS